MTNRNCCTQIDLDCDRAIAASNAASHVIDCCNEMIESLVEKERRALILKSLTLSRQRWISAIHLVVLRLRVFKMKSLLQKYNIKYEGCETDLPYEMTPTEWINLYPAVKEVESYEFIELLRIPAIKARKAFSIPHDDDDVLPPMLGATRRQNSSTKNLLRKRSTSEQKMKRKVTLDTLPSIHLSFLKLDEERKLFFGSLPLKNDIDSSLPNVKL
jgi:hypothetical protein